MPRKSAYSRLLEHFHTHPRGRLHEILFFSGLGAAFLLAAWLGMRSGKVSAPIAWILGIVGACLVGFSLLPQRKPRPPPPLPPGKRGAIAEQVQASKAEKKRKKR